MTCNLVEAFKQNNQFHCGARTSAKFGVRNHFDGSVCQRCVAGLTSKHITQEQDGAKMVLIPAGSFEMGDHFNQPKWWVRGGEDQWQ